MKNIYDLSNLNRVQQISVNRPYTKKDKTNGLSIVILTLDKPNYIIPLIQCLEKQAEKFKESQIAFEVLIGDTGSTDPKVLELYSGLKENFKVIRNLKYHFSKNNNEVAYTHASYDSILFLNNDTLIDGADILLKVYQALTSNPRNGVAGAVMQFENKRIQHAGIDFHFDESMDGYFPYHSYGNEKIESIKDSKEITNFAAVTGAFLMIKWNLFLKANGFDEFYNREAQDIDLCMKVKRLGYQIILTRFGTVFHFENGTRKKGEEDSSDRKRLVRKWNHFIKFGLTI
ncbi:glycosyltransferase [Leptospira ognonensis]|uniref:Glycosyltransferase n=1 Tax=Leptospira ognonensis TaxID=2484945 RepID=A0A4R9JX02_9LEPT|nr:glycosyltransferase [Leptospira ognonensis]TGL56540.1 glycosyltransferase [Leptospira ognonensis]